jgi:hypothetical protein
MGVVKFPEWVAYVKRRDEANVVMRGLMAGSNLAASLLDLTAPHEGLLGEIFPGLPHAKGFNVTLPEARRVLRDSENSVGMFAIPFVMGLHEDIIKTHLRMLVPDGYVGASKVRRTVSSEMHGLLEQATSRSFSADLLEVFEVLRERRNVDVHSAGLITKDALQKKRDAVGTAGNSLWVQYTGYALPNFAVNDRLANTTFGDLVLHLVVTKRLAEEANEMLQVRLPRESWAIIARDDMRKRRSRPIPDDITLNQKASRMISWVYNQGYRPLALTASECETALSAP